jgi:hypothetical protein
MREYRSVTPGTHQNRESNYAPFSPGAEGIQMRKITLLAAVVATVLIGFGAWVDVRTFTPAGALAGASDQPPVTVTGAKGLPTSHYDDYDLVVH